MLETNIRLLALLRASLVPFVFERYAKKDYRPTAVAHVCVTVRGKRYLLLIVPEEHKRKTKNRWKPPQGGVDPLELPLVAGLREAREETGIRIRLEQCNVREGGRIWRTRTPTLGWLGKLYMPFIYETTLDKLPPLKPAVGEVYKAFWFSEGRFTVTQLIDHVSGYDSVRVKAFQTALRLLGWRED
jgi:8-oxo-dGTP pyrophosphatase MutT (NUDIX family)